MENRITNYIIWIPIQNNFTIIVGKNENDAEEKAEEDEGTEPNIENWLLWGSEKVVGNAFGR